MRNYSKKLKKVRVIFCLWYKESIIYPKYIFHSVPTFGFSELMDRF